MPVPIHTVRCWYVCAQRRGHLHGLLRNKKKPLGAERSEGLRSNGGASVQREQAHEVPDAMRPPNVLPYLPLIPMPSALAVSVTSPSLHSPRQTGAVQSHWHVRLSNSGPV